MLARNQLFLFGAVTSPSFPFSLPSFLPLPLPLLPFLPSSLPSSPFPTPTPKIQLGDLRERYKLPSGFGQSPVAKRILVQLKVRISQITLINLHVHNICQ